MWVDIYSVISMAIDNYREVMMEMTIDTLSYVMIKELSLPYLGMYLYSNVNGNTWQAVGKRPFKIE